MRYFAVLGALLAMLVITPAWAQGHNDRGGHGNGGRFGGHGDMNHPPRMHGHGPMGPHGLKPLGRILHGIRQRHPGRLSDVRPGRGPHGEPHYRVKWLTPEGRIIWLDVDAQTGEVMGVDGANGRDRR